VRDASRGKLISRIGISFRLLVKEAPYGLLADVHEKSRIVERDPY
jgi:hypothetical protein